MLNFDFLVIGSGIAGLTYAIKVAKELPEAKIAIVTKGSENESNTKYAQGGIAVVTNSFEDSFTDHIADTLKAGDGLCDENIVKIVVTEGPERFSELIEWGVNFDKENDGNFNLGLEGGHSKNRILHHKDITGFEIEQKLLIQAHLSPNIQFFTQHFAVDLITDNKTHCFGAYVFDELNKITIPFNSKITLLATGGVGQLYQNTTNPAIATSDGIAMAYRAKAQISNMEFIQFHPTALYHDSSPLFLISEAVRGFGALLRNKKGELFMDKYDARKELASRDIVSRAIESELKNNGDDCAFLDCRHLNMTEFKNHFPNILQKLDSIGIDIKHDLIPVVPAAHYLCGGITVNEFGKSSIQNLYACGECSDTGLHGANRLASNSLLEALVFSNRCFEHAIKVFKTTPLLNPIKTTQNNEAISIEHLNLIAQLKADLKKIMTTYVGVVRNDVGLKIALNELQILQNNTEKIFQNSSISTEIIELRNMSTTAITIIQSSIDRTENKGVFCKLAKQSE
jgi:L-aspartate oxidase